MTVLQTIALPLGYSAVFSEREAIDYAACHNMSMPGLPENFRNGILPLAAPPFPPILSRAEKDR